MLLKKESVEGSEKMDGIKKFFNNIEEYIVVPILIVMTVVIILQVIFRFVIKGSLPWSEELSRYILVWVTFLGSSIAVKRGAHVGVELLVMAAPEKIRIFVTYLGLAISLLFCVIVFCVSLVIIKNQILSHQVSPAMRIPMWWAYGAVPVGTFLMSVRFIQTILKTRAINAAGRG